MVDRTFTFIVEGQYYGAHHSTGLPVIRGYKSEFKLKSLEGALSVIVKYLLEPFLTKHYEDYGRFRTHKITAMQVDGPLPSSAVLQKSFDEMTANELTDFCIIKRIFIDPHKHKDLEKCRQEVMKIYQNRMDQKKHDEKSGRAAEEKEIDALLELNNIPKLDPTAPNINMQRAGAALKNAGDGRSVEKVGFDAIGTRNYKAGSTEQISPVLNEPVEVGGSGATLEEQPVDNDPKLTAEAFAKGAKTPVEDIFA